MSPESLARVCSQLSEAEGRTRQPYYDTRGHLTLGVGHRLDGGAIPISDEAIDAILRGDVAEMIRRCERKVASWARISEVRQAALVELAFNGALFASPRALAAIERAEWSEAARELLDGPWRQQVGERRSYRLTAQIINGEWPA